MRVRNLWKKAYKEGRLNDIPADVRDKVVKFLGAKSKPEPKFSQFEDEELRDLEKTVEVD